MIIRRKITAFIILCFTLVLIVTLSDGAQAEATTKPGKPDISITMDDRTATITIGCTEGADGYKVLVNAPGDTKFKKMAFVKKHGKDEIVYLAKNLVNV